MYRIMKKEHMFKRECDMDNTIIEVYCDMCGKRIYEPVYLQKVGRYFGEKSYYRISQKIHGTGEAHIYDICDRCFNLIKDHFNIPVAQYMCDDKI